jgi:hypothetical protein
MKKVGVTFCSKRYEINLDDAFAEFVEADLKNAGVDFSIDNRPEALLRAYLRLAKQMSEIERALQKLADRLDDTIDIRQ